MNINATLTFQQFCDDLLSDLNCEAYLEKLLWPFDFYITDKTPTDVLVGHVIDALMDSKNPHEFLTFEEVLETASDLGHTKAEALLQVLHCLG